MQAENPAGRILYVTGNPNSNRLIILKEEKALYQKVDTNLNFVDREKKVEEFWKENHIFEKSMENRKEGRLTHSMTDRQQQTASRISAMC